MDADVDDFMHWLGTRPAVSTIRALRDQAERTRRHEVERAIRRLQLGESPEHALERLSQSLTNKLLHPPTQALHHAQEADREQLVKLVERVHLVSGGTGVVHQKDVAYAVAEWAARVMPSAPARKTLDVHWRTCLIQFPVTLPCARAMSTQRAPRP
jgi:hypothetical protein